MKKTKKIFSILMALVIIFTSSAVCIAAETTPFKNHRLPCFVGAADFDNGGEDVSYGKLSGSPTSNYVYRDGVCLNIYNSNGNVFIGTNAGGWYIYTINVPKSGIYSISIKGASDGPNAIGLALDGTEYSVTVPSSGSYQVPATTKVLELELEQGVHTLKYTHYSGGLNFYGINFEYLGEKNKIN